MPIHGPAPDRPEHHFVFSNDIALCKSVKRFDSPQKMIAASYCFLTCRGVASIMRGKDPATDYYRPNCSKTFETHAPTKKIKFEIFLNFP
jgi:hypothetical protein